MGPGREAGHVSRPGGVWTGVDERPAGDPVETPALRQAACCDSEPPCLLCPLRPENSRRSLRELRNEGLYANLVKLGFR